MDYEVFSRDENGELKGQKFQYPPPLSEGGTRENFNRKLTNAMYMMMRQDFLQNIIGPRICSWHPGAETISVSMRGSILPSMEKAKFMGTGREEISEISTQYLTDIYCQKELEE
ncbi:MAG: hypothetical protein KDD38_07250 [Bdellovibrionales bacterium]|nr:hypothetical protein [Bdellovibrionales bacterium]